MRVDSATEPARLQAEPAGGGAEPSGFCTTSVSNVVGFLASRPLLSDTRRMRGLVIAAAVLGLLLGASAPATAPPRPTLRLVSGTPLVVRGTGFWPSRRIRVGAQTREESLPKVVKTNRSGVFVARWTVPVGYCTGAFLVRATDSTGRTVSLRVAPVTRDCAPLAP